VQLDLSISGDEELDEKLRRIAASIEHARPLLTRVTRVLFAMQARRARRRGGKPLAPETLRQKARLGQPKQPLVATGRTMRSLTVPGAPDQLLHITDEEVVFGTKVFHARFHQAGTKHEPKRKLIAPTKKDRGELEQPFRDAFRKLTHA
jgi:phage gpG-like protein